MNSNGRTSRYGVIPPKISHLPKAVLSAECLRGNLVRCGPGYRHVSWPECPAVRLYAIGDRIGHKTTAAGKTAAWVWGAMPGSAVYVYANVLPSVRYPGEANNIELSFCRLQNTDVVSIGEYFVTTPLRTLLDLLYTIEPLPYELKTACQNLLTLIPGGANTVLLQLQNKRHPKRQTALNNFAYLFDPPAGSQTKQSQTAPIS